MTAKGIRNRNPLNLRPSGDNWRGLRAEQTDPGYLQFETDFYGLRAGAWNLLTYFRKHRRRTVRSIISAWAPPSDNNPTDHYVMNVCGALNVTPDSPINLEDSRVLRSMMQVMILVECGVQPYSQEALDSAINAAYAGHPLPPVTATDPSYPSVRPAPADKGPIVTPVPVTPSPEKPMPQPDIAPGQTYPSPDVIVPSPAKPPLVDQPTQAPTRKVVVGGIAGAVAFVVMVLWNKAFPDTPLAAEYATEIAGAVVLLVTLVTQYFTRNRASDIPPGNESTTTKADPL